MLKHVLLLPVFAALTPLTGCHQVYFYETNKVSLTLEARPDPTAPASGSLGLKQRVVAIVPPTNPTKVNEEPRSRLDAHKAMALAKVQAAASAAATQPRNDDRERELQSAMREYDRVASRGDAMSVLSTFKFRKHPRRDGQLFSRVTIDGALITGGAAITVADNDSATEAMQALSGDGLSFSASQFRRAAVRNIVDGLKQLPSSDLRAAALLRDLNQLESQIPAFYGLTLYKMPNATTLEVRARATDPIPGSGIAKVIDYQSLLADSEIKLSRFMELLSSGQSVSADLGDGLRILRTEDPARADLAADLARQLAVTTEKRQALERQLITSPAYRAAMRHLLGL